MPRQTTTSDAAHGIYLVLIGALLYLSGVVPTVAAIIPLAVGASMLYVGSVPLLLPTRMRESRSHSVIDVSGVLLIIMCSGFLIMQNR